MRKLDLIVVVRDDHGEPIDPPKIVTGGILVSGTPDPNGWLFQIDIPEEEAK